MTIQSASAQEFVANYDESKIPSYTLPELLVCEDGTPVKTAKDWTQKRRPEIFALFEEHVYGKTPSKAFTLQDEVEIDGNALGGKAVRKQVALYPFGKDAGLKMELLVYLPKNAKMPVPVFVGLNFKGNHTINADPGIRVSDRWLEEMKRKGEKADIDASRGNSSSRWAVDQILDHGYGVATMYYYDIEPDYDDGFQNGIQPYFYPSKDYKLKPDEWGSIGAWAWGLSRIMDYFERDAQIDEKQVALLGHSRLGKTSLWCGASDPRFAIVISNDSGCGGAALSRRRIGETVGRINRVFPHWFNDNFNQYNENEDALPVDQHMLIALIAPRPVYVASAQDDRWADPNGEFTSAKLAGPVYELFGKKGVGVDEQPEVNHPVGEDIRYHIRTGKHDVTEYDWQQYLKFADRHFKK
ncbi:acetylxylan esterase [bacterium]|nr:acetylxylan esterase [bacterium]